jgi:hypothetical protein
MCLEFSYAYCRAGSQTDSQARAAHRVSPSAHSSSCACILWPFFCFRSRDLACRNLPASLVFGAYSGHLCVGVMNNSLLCEKRPHYVVVREKEDWNQDTHLNSPCASSSVHNWSPQWCPLDARTHLFPTSLQYDSSLSIIYFFWWHVNFTMFYCSILLIGSKLRFSTYFPLLFVVDFPAYNILLENRGQYMTNSLNLGPMPKVELGLYSSFWLVVLMFVFIKWSYDLSTKTCSALW